MLIFGATITGVTMSNPDLEFNDIGIGSVTLKSTTAAFALLLATLKKPADFSAGFLFTFSFR